ncbi:MAG TPA: hypothetical protein VLV45_11480 [Gemmatimonadales bacterium]|nr:hypothetical protein [Gemmatimonadales bacterium]
MGLLRRALAAAAFATAIGTTVLAAQGAPAPPPPPAPAPNPLTVGALVYTQYQYFFSDSAQGLNRFDVTRAYINVIGKWSNGMYARITGDIFTNTDSSRAYRLKYAYAAYTPAKSPLTYKAGLIHTPWLDWEETLWDYRVQGSMPMERNGYLSSADFGLGIDGMFNHEQANFQITAVNGENYNKGTGDDGKDIQARLSVRLVPSDDPSRVGGLRITAYGGWGTPNTGGARSRVIGLISYKSKLFTLAAEAASTRDSTTGAPPAVPSTKPLNGHVYAAYGVYHVPHSHAAIIARVDRAKPQSGTVSVAASQWTNRYIAGISYQLTPQWRLLADVDYLSYELTPTAAQKLQQGSAFFQTQINF